MSTETNTSSELVLCLDNRGYEASLLIGKVYPTIPDANAESHGHLRVVHESGDDYAFAAPRFYRLTLPEAVATKRRHSATV